MIKRILLAVAIFASPLANAQSSEEVASLKRELQLRATQLENQRTELERQQEELARQKAELERQATAIEALEMQSKQSSPPGSGQTMRDAVGDLNSAAVAAGEFPGSILIPGTEQVSLAIGGFVKAVGIMDSDIEGTGPIFLPANIGSSRADSEGATSFDASLSRIILDARAPTQDGSVRGYIEVDLNKANNGSPDMQIRHAYGTWRIGSGTLTAGHTWSTAMDLGVLPEGLTEPTLSGAIFQRQAQLRWSQPLTDRFTFDVALEDGTSADATIAAPWRATTRLPDLVAAAEWSWGRSGHVRAAGLLRGLRVADDSGRTETANAWEASLSGHVAVGENGKFAVGANVGEGVGRYLLGVPGGSAGFIDVGDTRLELLQAMGAYATYRHQWTQTMRSTVGYGRAWVEDAAWQSADAFDSSTFVLANLMWSPIQSVTLGLEYQYGERETKDGLSRDNNRVILGVQIF